MDASTLERWNTWWKTGQVKQDLLKPFKRELYFKVTPYLQKRQILLFQGLRRVGKTTLLYQLINDLLKTEKAVHILYFSFDEQPCAIADVLETYQKHVLGKSFEETITPIYLFFDEVQKIDDWENKLKVYYDLYPRLKFFLSGSASVRLRMRSKESLAGRIFDFTLEPLSFSEFLSMHGRDLEQVKKKPELWKREILPLFYRYIKYGSFPELVYEENEEVARKYILETVIERIIYKDLPEEFPIKDLNLLRMLVTLVAQKPGMLLNYRQLAQDLGKDQRTITAYFEYLEFSLLVKYLFNYRGSPLASMRKAKKVYLATPNIAFAYATSYELVFPYLLENMVVNKTSAKFFYRNGYEVDVVLETKGGIVGIEIKKGKGEVKQLQKFKTSFGKKVNKVFVVSLEEEGEEDGIPVIPLWKFLLDAQRFVAN